MGMYGIDLHGKVLYNSRQEMIILGIEEIITRRIKPNPRHIIHPVLVEWFQLAFAILAARH